VVFRKGAGPATGASAPREARKARHKQPSKSSPQETQHWWSIYVGRECLGHVVGRGRAGFESFDANDHSLGIFPSVKLAADAVSEAR
jgi:hypothetical protein